MAERDYKIDVYRGILILLVVAAHFQSDLLHDIIFLFHMPLFFILSGFLIKIDKIVSASYLRKKTLHMIIPYCTYIIFDYGFCKQNLTLSSVIRMIWGGRAIDGVYWYITCYLAAMCLFAFLVKHFGNKSIKALIFTGETVRKL